MAYRGNDVHSTVNYNFVALKNASFDVKLTYDMTSNKENNNSENKDNTNNNKNNCDTEECDKKTSNIIDSITTDVHFLCEELTVQAYNI